MCDAGSGYTVHFLICNWAKRDDRKNVEYIKHHPGSRDKIHQVTSLTDKLEHRGKGKLICADNYYGTVRIVDAMRRRGIHYLCAVKSRSGVPKEILWPESMKRKLEQVPGYRYTNVTI